MFRSVVVRVCLGAGVGAALVACGGSDNDDATPPSSPSRTVQASRIATAASPSPTGTPFIADTPTPHPTQAPAMQAEPPPPQPTETPAVTAPPPAQPPAPAALTIVAVNIEFVPDALSAPSGATVKVMFDNQDVGIEHDIVIRTPSGGTAAQSPVITGPAQATVSFTASEPGSYRFVCSLHPQQMLGAISVS